MTLIGKWINKHVGTQKIIDLKNPEDKFRQVIAVIECQKCGKIFEKLLAYVLQRKQHQCFYCKINPHPGYDNIEIAKKMHDNYMLGASLSQVAKKFNTKRGIVHHIFNKHGFKSRPLPTRLETVEAHGIKFSKHKDGWRETKGAARRYLHRLNWELANGPIPNDMQVCFKDDNVHNAEISNLEIRLKGYKATKKQVFNPSWKKCGYIPKLIPRKPCKFCKNLMPYNQSVSAYEKKQFCNSKCYQDFSKQMSKSVKTLEKDLSYLIDPLKITYIKS